MKDLLSICKHRSFLCFDEYSIFAIYNYGGKKKNRLWNSQTERSFLSNTYPNYHKTSSDESTQCSHFYPSLPAAPTFKISYQPQTYCSFSSNISLQLRESLVLLLLTNRREHDSCFPKLYISQRFKTFTSDTSFCRQVVFPRTNSNKWHNSSQSHLQNMFLHNITYKTSCYQLSSTVYPLLLGKPT